MVHVWCKQLQRWGYRQVVEGIGGQRNRGTYSLVWGEEEGGGDLAIHLIAGTFIWENGLGDYCALSQPTRVSAAYLNTKRRLPYRTGH